MAEKIPFENIDTPKEIAKMVAVKGERPDIGELPKEVGAGVRWMIEKGWSDNSNDRLTAREVVRVINDVLDHAE